MLMRRTDKGYEFESATVNGAFIVRLSLGDEGSETLETCPVGVPVCFKTQELSPGTIEKTLGPERWKIFQHAKKMGINTMFIDPHQPETGPRTW